MAKKAVVAVGGHAIKKSHQKGTIPEQFANIARISEHIADMAEGEYDIIVTHGNGPQVGNVLLRSELAEDILYPLPLDICDSDTQGGMGYMVQQVLGNVLRKRGIDKSVVTVITQVVVDPNDTAFKKPTKPIGPFYDRKKAERYRVERGWEIIKDGDRGYRRVVPSPEPLEIVEKNIIKRLVDAGTIVVAVGGGGIPVISAKNGTLKGVEAVVDKDLASSLLASNLHVDLFLISTDVEKVSLNYNKPNQHELDHLTVTNAKKYLAQGQFPPGNMGPKIEAGIRFLEKGGKEVIITTPECIAKALSDETGTHLIRG